MLAADHPSFRIGEDTYVLRPSLAAAIRLERTLSLPEVFSRLREGCFTTLLKVAELGCSSEPPLKRGRSVSELPLSFWFPNALAACAEFVVRLYDLGGSDEPETPGKVQTYAEAFADLYRIGTGHLGWTPAATLDAAPIEIVEAARGCHAFIGDILMAVFGKPEGAPDTRSAPDYARDPDASSTLRDLGRAF